MKIKIEIELDGSGRDVAALNAITKAISNLPPKDLEIYPSGDVPDMTPVAAPTKVQVWAKSEKTSEAVANVVTAPNVEVETKPVDSTKPTPPPIQTASMVTKVANPTDDDKKAAMLALRQLVLDASGKPGITAEQARAAAIQAVGKEVKAFTYDDIFTAMEAVNKLAS